MKRQELLERMRATRQQLESIIAGLTPDALVEPGVAGEWSVKDMLAHIAWYEREEAAFYGETGVPESPLWNLPQDPRNEMIFRENRDRPLDDVLAEFRDARQRFEKVVAGLSEDELNDPGRFPDTSEERPPWLAIATHSYLHDDEHIEMILAWSRGGAT